MVHQSEGVRHRGLNSLRQVIEVDNLLRWLWLHAVQPVKEFNQHLQSLLLTLLHAFAPIRYQFLLFRTALEAEEPPLERDGIGEEKLRSTAEPGWDSLLGEGPRQGPGDVGEHEGNVVRQRFGEDGGQSGEYIVGANNDAWNVTIGEDENGIDGVDVLLNFSSNILPVVLGLFNVSQSRGVENANLGKRLRTLATFKNSAAYSYAIVAGNFVQTRIVGLTLVIRTALLVGDVEDVVV